MVGFLCLGETALGGNNAPLQSSPTPNPENLGAPWSFDLNSAYTLGSRIQKAGNLGSQAEYRYEIEALRNFRITGDYYLQFGIDYERFDFSRSNSTFPYAFTSLSGEILFSYWSGDTCYTPNDRLEIYLGGELIGDSYRNGPTDDRRTNNAIVEYEEERLGLGLSYTLRKGIDFEANAGWTLERTYDYIRSGPIYHSKGAPYFRVDLSFAL